MPEVRGGILGLMSVICNMWFVCGHSCMHTYEKDSTLQAIPLFSSIYYDYFKALYMIL
jgi:hypothetical protein